VGGGGDVCASAGKKNVFAPPPWQHGAHPLKTFFLKKY